MSNLLPFSDEVSPAPSHPTSTSRIEPSLSVSALLMIAGILFLAATAIDFRSPTEDGKETFNISVRSQGLQTEVHSCRVSAPSPHFAVDDKGEWGMVICC